MARLPRRQERGCGVSDTPITDANVCITTKEGYETIAPDICRKFERENAALREAIKEAHEDIEQTFRFVSAFVHRIREGRRMNLGAWLRDAEVRLHNVKIARSKLQPFLKP